MNASKPGNTGHTPADPDLRDPRLDTAWREASREEPSAALDDAILAAARREVGAGPIAAGSETRPAPRRGATRAAHVPEATRPERWWWPLAAAATIGAIAFGLLQLKPPDNGGPSVVSDMPAPATTTPAPPPPRGEPAALAKVEEAGGSAERVRETAGARATEARAPAPASKVAVRQEAVRQGAAQHDATLPVAEWIAKIRRLRDEGKLDEAAKELAAFRAAYPDHEQRLPADLRDWRVPVK